MADTHQSRPFNDPAVVLLSGHVALSKKSLIESIESGGRRYGEMRQKLDEYQSFLTALDQLQYGTVHP